jgi:hypothetical protein
MALISKSSSILEAAMMLGSNNYIYSTNNDNFEVYIRSPRPEPIQLIVRDQYGQRLEVLEISPDTAIQFGSDLKRGLYIIEIIQGEMTAMQRVVKR